MAGSTRLDSMLSILERGKAAVLDRAFIRDYMHNGSQTSEDWEKLRRNQYIQDTCFHFGNSINIYRKEFSENQGREEDITGRLLGNLKNFTYSLQKYPHYEVREFNQSLLELATYLQTVRQPFIYKPIIVALDPYRWVPSRRDETLKIHFLARDMESGRDAEVVIENHTLSGKIENGCIHVRLPQVIPLVPGLKPMTIRLPTKDWLSFLRDDWTEVDSHLLVEKDKPFTFEIMLLGPYSAGAAIKMAEHGERPSPHMQWSTRSHLGSQPRLVCTVQMGRGEKLAVPLIPGWSTAEIKSTYATYEEYRAAEFRLQPKGGYTGAGWTAQTTDNTLNLHVFDL